MKTNRFSILLLMMVAIWSNAEASGAVTPETTIVFHFLPSCFLYNPFEQCFLYLHRAPK
jgi:hypothetical protein